MAQFDVLIPFVLHFEVGLQPEYLTGTPEQMFARARQRPKAYAVLKGDKGGPTMCGVTIGTYTRYRRLKGHATTTVDDLKAMSYTEWRDIYKDMFWDRWRADDIRDQSVANMLVDFTWHSGANGIKIPQRVLGVKADGVVGPRTLAAVNTADPSDLFDRLKTARLDYLDGIIRSNPSQARFRLGWHNRVNSIVYGGFVYSD